jgi:hypothetical protein
MPVADKLLAFTATVPIVLAFSAMPFPFCVTSMASLLLLSVKLVAPTLVVPCCVKVDTLPLALFASLPSSSPPGCGRVLPPG